MFLLQIAIFIISPVAPKYQVEVLKQTDLLISVGNAYFYVIYMFGSLKNRSAAARLGYQRLIGIGMAILSVALFIFAVSYRPWIYIIHLSISGIGWALLGGGQVNFILERVPADDRASHLAWFTLVNNGGLLLCGLLAPTIASVLGLFGTLMLAVGMRAVVAVGFLRRV